MVPRACVETLRKTRKSYDCRESNDSAVQPEGTLRLEEYRGPIIRHFTDSFALGRESVLSRKCSDFSSILDTDGGQSPHG
jgi:hypothetical protein